MNGRDFSWVTGANFTPVRGEKKASLISSTVGAHLVGGVFFTDFVSHLKFEGGDF